MRILIVEDEESLANGLRFNFAQEGYDAVVASDGAEALAILEQEGQPVDLVVLDLMLPGMSGYDTCKAIREMENDIPILVLSARTLSEDKVHAFECGTDQYLTKPFALPELLSRVRNLLERRRLAPNYTSEKPASDTFEFGQVQVDFRKFEIKAGEQTHNLTTTEMQLLRYFIEHEGIVLPRSQILEDVWGVSSEVTTRTIDNFVLRLRKIIESNPAQPLHLVSVRGTGYRFFANPEAASD